MSAFSSLWSRKWWVLLAILVLLNVIRFWPHHKVQAATGGQAGPQFGQPDPRMQAQIDALPDDQKLAAQNWMSDTKKFADSVQSLPEDQRRQKMQEHFAQNPPPAGMPVPGPGGPPPDGGGSPPPGGPPGGPGGPGGAGGPDGSAPHIPAPEQRHDMDQHMVNDMKSAGLQ
jgi:hypothetical protein